ncbi:MAG: hypothetical protein M3R24_15925 [Chloroflexota bacterium]|nr:hypothetical protein [Chloroflexota bacterium]
MAVHDQAGEQVDDKVDGTAATRVLDLRAVFELVEKAFNDRSRARHERASERHELKNHSALAMRDQLDVQIREQATEQGL